MPRGRPDPFLNEIFPVRTPHKIQNLAGWPMTTYCSNPKCDNRCGQKPPVNLGPGTYVWGDFCSPTRYPPADEHECPPTGVVCPVCVDVAEEDEAEPDEPTDSELADMPDLPPMPDLGGSD